MREIALVATPFSPALYIKALLMLPYILEFSEC